MATNPVDRDLVVALVKHAAPIQELADLLEERCRQPGADRRVWDAQMLCLHAHSLLGCAAKQLDAVQQDDDELQPLEDDDRLLLLYAVELIMGVPATFDELGEVKAILRVLGRKHGLFDEAAA